MRRPGGPKPSAARVPRPVVDVYQDLRDRHLLPLVALILVAIVAVPFLLGSDAEKAAEAPAASEVSRSLRSAAADAPALTVVESRPGLRDYRERLGGRTSANPFKQHHTGPSLKGARFRGGDSDGDAEASGTDGGGSGGGGSAGGKAGDTGGTVTVTAGDGGRGRGGEADGREGNPTRGRHLILFDWGIDVQIRRLAGDGRPRTVTRERVLPQTALPGEKVPVVTYMGVARDGKKINGRLLLLISDQVHGVASDGRCVSGTESCQLLEVTPGFPVVLTYGEREVQYVLSVSRLRLVVTGRQ